MKHLPLTVKVFAFIGVLATAFFIVAGRLDLPLAWVYFGLYLAYVLILPAYLKNPDLLAERMAVKSDAKQWDVHFNKLFSLLNLVTFVVIALDVGRFQWQPTVPLMVSIVAFVVATLAYLWMAWSMSYNPFFSRIVRIQTDRGHHVVRDGPYQYMRHPGYVGVITYILATPLAFGSFWGLIPSLIVVVGLLWRTGKEDQTLQQELEGYLAYTQKVRYRLLPNVW